MSEKIRTIYEGDIKQLASAQSFERGQRYYRGGAILEPVRQGNELRGYCEGSEYQPYRITVTLGVRGIESTYCTCPYDWGGICKHIAALLLMWVHEPETFTEIPPVDETLANRSKEELVALIKEMLKREPDLARLLELPVQPGRSTPLDLEAFRRQISYALRHHDYYDYSDAHATATELSSLVETAGRFQKGGDWANAGALYALILTEVVPKYDELYDEEGDIAIELQNCAEGLDECFSESDPDTVTRREWLTALLDAHLKDIEMGGIDLATPAGDLVVEHATDEEWAWIKTRVQQAIAAQSGHFSDWPREALVRFLAARLQATGHEAQTDELIFELGSPQQQAFLLIERGRYDEAVAIAQKHFSDLPGLVTRFADALVEAGAGEAAERYVAGLQDGRGGTTYLVWLAQHAERKGDLSAAVTWWRQSLGHAPSFQTYLAIRKVAEQLNQWGKTRLELITELEAKEAWHILVEIALDEDEVGRALDLLPQVKGWYSRDYELRVAQAAEKDYPQEAIAIYDRRARQLINARGRGNYHEAAQLLQRAKNVYQQHHDKTLWAEYVTSLRHEHRNLPALQDELRKAGL